MVVREPDGTMRKASWEERDRINQVYNPIPGRLLQHPPMFDEDHLEVGSSSDDMWSVVCE